MILRIIQAELAGAFRLRVAFNDGSRGTTDVLPLLHGPIFEPLRNPARFAEATLDALCGTVVWPNGADLAPEALHALLKQETIASSTP